MARLRPWISDTGSLLSRNKPPQKQHRVVKQKARPTQVLLGQSEVALNLLKFQPSHTKFFSYGFSVSVSISSASLLVRHKRLLRTPPVAEQLSRKLLTVLPRSSAALFRLVPPRLHA